MRWNFTICQLVKVWIIFKRFLPIKRLDVLIFTSGILGLGYGQAFAAFCVLTYYCSLMGLTLYYLVASFQSELPWSYCREEWKDYCVDTVSKDNNLNGSASLLTIYNGTFRSSAELYFRYVDGYFYLLIISPFLFYKN